VSWTGRKGDYRIEVVPVIDGNGRRYWRSSVDGRNVAKAWAWKDIDGEPVWLTRRGARAAARRWLSERST
jgi:hypothetical protein